MSTNLNATETKRINLSVLNIDTDRAGVITVMLFNEQGFPKVHSEAVFKQSKKASQSKMDFELPAAMPVFAIKVHHDENEDGLVTKDWTKIIPAEGLGFSNGAKLSWRGAPRFEDAKQALGELDSSLTISLIYP